MVTDDQNRSVVFSCDVKSLSESERVTIKKNVKYFL